MNAVSKLEQFIFEAKAWKLLLVLGLLTLFKTGIWYIPIMHASLAIAQNPFVNPFAADPNAHYVFWSWLGPYLAWLVGATGKLSFFLFHLVFSFAFTLLFVKIAFDNLPQELARKSVILFSVLPVSATAYFWVCYDSITLFLIMLALAFPQRLLIASIVGVLVGMQHFEQGFFGAGGLLFALLLSQRQGYFLRYSWKFALALLIGIIVGKLVLVGIFRHYEVQVNSGRMHWLRDHLGFLFNLFIYHVHGIFWSVLGLGWAVALRFTDWGRKSIPFFLTLAGLCLLLPISGDQTRVLAIVSFPLITAYWLLNQDFLGKVGRHETAWLFIIWAMMPWSWVWDGEPKWSAFPYDVAFVLHHLFGWFEIPADPSRWPF
ncbi:hypothetical protein [Massilia sp. 9I]|uniref:hypothetical protein n=1 Tax=Massilia sp. 9I TaxID=2653152 RepID=UPI0012F2FBF1|nr:hypothetical protein [Massilia sp. 9I]VXC06812.1 conserved membrane hypothetical protein [Massilia sp. 9I]